MDLLAYDQIDELEKLAEANGIKVPRLRGYRLMSEERPVSKEELKTIEANALSIVYERYCTSEPLFSTHPFCYEYSNKTDRIKKRFLTKDGKLRWERIHGKRRKNVKYLLKKKKEAIRKEYGMWNKYAGQKNVLYIHTRCGGNNWEAFGCESIVKQPWYLGRADDSFDETYCTIYAKVDTSCLSIMKHGETDE